MTARNLEITALPAHAALPRWPIYQIDGCYHSANLYLVPGIQAPRLVLGYGTISCGITNIREALGPGVGTLFHESFADLDNACAVSAAAMRMGHQAIRQHLLEQLIEETMHAHHILLQAMAALKADDLNRYVSLCHDAEGLICLLSIRTSWLAGIIAIMGGPEDPLLRRHSQSARVAETKVVVAATPRK